MTTSVMLAMPREGDDEPSPEGVAATYARALARLAPGGAYAVLPLGLWVGRDALGRGRVELEWSAYPSEREASEAALRDVMRRARDVARPAGVSLAVEGVRRVTLGGSRSLRKLACGVAHVTADGEPARVVFWPLDRDHDENERGGAR